MRRLSTILIALLVGTLSLGGCGFSVYDLPLPGGADTGSDPLTVKVQFADVLDLVPQSTVKVDDLTVGKVTKVELDHGVAVVTMELRKDTDLPADARAEIQQTSLLGEKYVALSAPASGDSGPRLKSGDTIPLANTGRNPEVEEVLGALSLILNGGGVAQLKTIATELNKALGGREDSARSVLDQVNKLVTNLDDNKQDIVDAIASVNRLSKSVHKQEKTIDATLDELPSALTSIDAQRKDLVTMLKALDHLGDTGVKVINASKDNTVAVVRDLQPVLTELANSGDHFVNSFNTFLTYPFVDAAVGNNPQVARNLHMGDYVNLDVTLDLDMQSLKNLPDIPQNVCMTVNELRKRYGGQLNDILDWPVSKLCNSDLAKSLSQCQHVLQNKLADGQVPLPLPAECAQLPQSLTSTLKDLLGGISGQLQKGLDPCKLLPVLCSSAGSGDSTGSAGSGTGSGSSSGSGGDGGGVLGGLGGLLGGGSNRAPTAYATQRVSIDQLDKAFDPSLVALMVPGLDTGDPLDTEGGTR